MKKYIVTLTPEERSKLSTLISTEDVNARKIIRARILLKSDQGPAGPAWTDPQISGKIKASPSTIKRIRRRFVERGMEATLQHQALSSPRPLKVGDEQEELLMTLVHSQPPPDHRRWTLRLLAAQMVEQGYIKDISHETVRQVLKKRNHPLK